MYENVITNIKKQKHNSLFIILGISLILLFVALGLNIAKHFRNSNKNTNNTQKTQKTTQSNTSKKTTKSTQANVTTSENGVVNVYVPAGFPIAYPGTQVNFVLPNQQTLVFVPQSKQQSCPEPKVVEKVIEKNISVPTKPKLIIKSTENKTVISSSNSSSSSTSINGTSTHSTSTSTSGPNASASANSN